MSIAAALQKSLSKSSKNVEASNLQFSSLNLSQVFKQQVQKWNTDPKYTQQIDTMVEKTMMSASQKALNMTDHLSIVLESYPDTTQTSITQNNFEEELSKQFGVLSKKYQTQETKEQMDISQSQQGIQLANVQIKEFVVYIQSQLKNQLSQMFENLTIEKLMDSKQIFRFKQVLQQVQMNFDNIAAQKKQIYEQFNVTESNFSDSKQDNVESTQVRSLSKLIDLQNKYSLIVTQNQAYMTRNNALEEERVMLQRKIQQLEDYNRHKGSFTEQIVLASKISNDTECQKCKYIDSIVEENQRLRQQLNDSIISHQNMQSSIIDLQKSGLKASSQAHQILNLHHNTDDIDTIISNARSQIQ